MHVPFPRQCWDVIAKLRGYVVVQFYPWFKFDFPLFWGTVMYDDEFKTMGNKNYTKDKIKPQQLQQHCKREGENKREQNFPKCFKVFV